MKFAEFEKLISIPRLAKYKIACAHDSVKTIELYRANIHLSNAFLGLLGMFEVVLRNTIDAHYQSLFHGGSKDNKKWLIAATLPGGFLTQRGCESSLKKIEDCYAKLGNMYSHDKLIAEQSFGFWKFLFANKQYRAGGSTLLKIFPYKIPKTNASDIYSKLDKINEIRNRIAHHKPICFGKGNTVNTEYARSNYYHILDLLAWMDINSQRLFYGLDTITRELEFIDNINSDKLPM